MDKYLLEYLNKHKINYKIHKHSAVFTVEQSKSLKAEILGVFHTKNLFLKDEANNFYLICMNAHKRLDLKNLKQQLNAKKKLYFASEKELKENLNLTPGSVSIFGMIYARNVFLVIDKKILEAESSGFHPNINTATLEINKNNLRKFINSLNCKLIVLQLK